VSIPKRVTFTGLDNLTDLRELAAISHAYPGMVEWGILFGLASNRFPSLDTIRAAQELEWEEVDFALHLCGPDAQAFVAGYAVTSLFCRRLGNFVRVQVNAARYPAPERLSGMASFYLGKDVPVIMQVRGPFPAPAPGLQYLYDCSAGRGKLTLPWPAPGALDGSCGYAGGLGPETIREALAACPAPDGTFWVDMESGVRSGEDFDLAKCRRVLELVYGL